MMMRLIPVICVLFGVIISIHLRPAAACPSMCNCIWRNNKQTALCERQSLIAIPKGINPQTQVLHISNNNFQILPSRVFQERGLTNLQKIFIADSKLGIIADDAFVQLTNLIELDIGGNVLTQVPTTALQPCINLRRLVLSQNPIQTLRAGAFVGIGQLKSIELSKAQIDAIEPGAFTGLERLEFLKLDDNRLTSLAGSIVADLPPLYSFDLHRNPWNCDCELRSAREWMLRNNVPQSIPPTCAGPDRVAGMMWNSLDIDDFACWPVIQTSGSEVKAYTGNNATLSCLVKGTPPPRVYWYIDDGTTSTGRNLSGNHYLVEEKLDNGLINSMLTIVDAQDSDSRSFICSAENRAGISMKNLTLTVVDDPSWFGSWSRMELAGAVIGALAVLIVGFVGVSVAMMRSRKPMIKPFHSKVDSLKQLKFSSSPVSIIGTLPTLKKQPSGCRVAPDLTRHGQFNYCSGFIDSPHDQPIIGNQIQTSIPMVPMVDNPANCQQEFDNYQDVYDADGYGIGLPATAAGSLWPFNGHPMAIEDDFGRMSLYGVVNPNLVLDSSSQPSPSIGANSIDQRWKRLPVVGGPDTEAPMIRYSPDEGYAEEVSHSEGTEV